VRRVAIIGAGIFGSEIAIQLAKKGYRVKIIEKNSDILLEATAKSQNRLHLGLHYPRDLDTAIQSRNGYVNFVRRFPASVRNNFSNYYGLSRDDSKVSLEEYEEFAGKAGIEITAVEKIPELDVAYSKLSRIWSCFEGVIDISTLRKQLRKEMLDQGVELHLNSEITGCKSKNSNWHLNTPTEEFGGFDNVIRTTYGLDHIASNIDLITNRKYEYHHTMILEVKSKNPTVGMTIVDGDFITLLPNGFSNDFLLYAPMLSVRAKFQGSQYPVEWDQARNKDFDSMEEKLIERAKDWFPSFQIEGQPKRNITVRSIQPNVGATDKRVSEIRKIADGFYDVWSGKIDHCVEVSQDIVRMISEE
jgi:glycine/D-amino acid oxidase-like deaminating enzyme